jgi:protein-glutamine gamma-glutamyltransferase
LRFTEPQRYRWASAMSLVSLRDEPVTMIAYRVEGMVSGAVIPDAKFGALLKETGRQPASAGALMLGLQLREDDQTTLSTIVDAIRGGAPVSAADYSQRAKAWLAERHSYTLKPSIPAGTGDPLIRWINSREGGHCELFAGSLVVLARAAGLPARMVTGFYGGSWNGFSDNFTLRNSDAHAWCEIFDVTTQSWLRVDPTPGTALAEGNTQRGEAAISRRLDRSWKARLESLRVFWYRQIVNFDQRSQMEALTTVKEASENSSRRVRASLDRWGQRIRAWVATPWDVRRIAGFVSILALLIVGGMVAVHAHRFFKYRSWRSSRTGSADRVRAEAGKWLARLSKHASVDGGTTQREQVVEELQRIRFGRKETWSDVAPVLRRARNVWRQDRRRRAGEPRDRDGLRINKDAKHPGAGR